MNHLLVAVTVLGGAAAVAQIRITSFKPSGDLTWTNSVTNAVYRVQWASEPTGLWNSFSTQTNLNSIQAHSNRVTVNVPIASGDPPQFLRVGWTDAPPYAGLYELREYDKNGILMVTGSLWLAGERGSSSPKGTRNLSQVSGTTNDPGPQLGSGDIYGGFNAPSASLDVSLTPWIDDNVDLYGFLVGNTYQGQWAHYNGGHGWFTAAKQKCDPPPPRIPWAPGNTARSRSVGGRQECWLSRRALVR